MMLFYHLSFSWCFDTLSWLLCNGTMCTEVQMSFWHSDSIQMNFKFVSWATVYISGTSVLVSGMALSLYLFPSIQGSLLLLKKIPAFTSCYLSSFWQYISIYVYIYIYIYTLCGIYSLWYNLHFLWIFNVILVYSPSLNRSISVYR